MITRDLKRDEEKQTSVFVDEKTQKDLNKPLEEKHIVSETEKEFLEMLNEMIKTGKVDLYKPSSLINYKVYDLLTEEQRGRADFEAVNLLSAIREIKDLYDQGFAETYQMEYLVQRLRLTKERLENKGGDIYII